ncbi:MAG: hypothetical protein IJN81_03185 [Clostridia bacterium]|nr:hypothetical protein [Clostridia bacterium]
MMKTKIICLILSLVFVVGAFGVGGTYAWFITYAGGSGRGVVHNFLSGNIGYTLVGGFIDSETMGTIQPEVNLLTKLENIPENLEQNTKLYLVPIKLEADLPEGEEKTQKYVDAQLRMKVFYTYIDDAGNMTDGYSVVGQSTDSRPFVAQLATDTNGKVYWQYDAETGYFNYVNPETNSDIIVGGLEAVDPIPLFTAMYYSGENTDIPTAVFKDNNEFTVKIAFQAKQADAAWKDIGEITFNTQQTETEEPSSTQAQS